MIFFNALMLRTDHHLHISCLTTKNPFEIFIYVSLRKSFVRGDVKGYQTRDFNFLQERFH